MILKSITISKNTPLYASKSYSSTEIIKYNKKNFEQSKDICDPIHGTKKDKGKKIIDRAKLLCSILENKPKYKNRCSIIKSITDKDLIKSNDEKIELFSSFAE